MLIGQPVGSRIPHWPGGGFVRVKDTSVGSSTIEIPLAQLSVADSAIGSTTLYSTIMVRILDNATGTTSTYSLNVSMIIPDSGAGSEVITIPKKVLFVSDSSTGTEQLRQILSIPDTASGTEVGNLIAYSTITDSGLGSEQIILEGFNKVFEYLGDLDPGETLEVDAEKLLVTKGSSNERPNFDGNYLILPSGDNQIYYSDDESGRTVILEVSKKDKTI